MPWPAWFPTSQRYENEPAFVKLAVSDALPPAAIVGTAPTPTTSKLWPIVPFLVTLNVTVPHGNVLCDKVIPNSNSCTLTVVAAGFGHADTVTTGVVVVVAAGGGVVTTKTPFMPSWPFTEERKTT